MNAIQFLSSYIEFLSSRFYCLQIKFYDCSFYNLNIASNLHMRILRRTILHICRFTSRVINKTNSNEKYAKSVWLYSTCNYLRAEFLHAIFILSSSSMHAIHQLHQIEEFIQNKNTSFYYNINMYENSLEIRRRNFIKLFPQILLASPNWLWFRKMYISFVNKISMCFSFNWLFWKV